MSRQLRSGFAAIFLVAGFSSPASCNVITDLFTPKASPDEPTAAAAPAPAEDDCLPRPGKSADGQRWVYRLDGHRKCWHQVSDDAPARKPARHRAARHSVAASEQDTPAPRKQKEDVADARAELVSPAPAEAPQPTPPEPQLKIVKVVKVADAASAPVTEAAALVPPAPVLARPSVDQLTPDQLRAHHVDVETLLADAPAASDEVAANKAMPVAAARAGTDGGAGWTATWLGALLMALGIGALLSSSPALRQVLLTAPLSRPERDFDHGARRDPSWSDAA